MRKTPLNDEHKKLGGKLVEFAGWEMPVQYSGVIVEHTAVRERVGLFDVSHMGEIWVTGKNAEATLDYLTCNKVTALVDGKAHYSALLNHSGGVIDDIIIYRFNREKFLLCVNASNAEKDFTWLKENNPTDADIQNVSDQYGQIAVQGPSAVDLLSKLVSRTLIDSIKYFHFAEVEISGDSVILARTGYTGEDGFEIFVKTEAVVKLWNTLLEVGEEFGVLPCGLGARDSLRLEAAYPLHGHELAEDISALESGLSWIVKFDKGDFLGRAALLAQRDGGTPRALVGLVLREAGITRQGDTVVGSIDDTEIGFVTSGTKTPTVNQAIGMALVKQTNSAVGSSIGVRVRGRRITAEIVQLPFYKRAK